MAGWLHERLNDVWMDGWMDKKIHRWLDSGMAYQWLDGTMDG